jgi:FMN hydrolase / 5-amino-6-(5-phospho-D-ribitylamino)uracil phosphatase
MASSDRSIILFDVMETLVSEPFFEHVPAFFGMTLDELLAAKDPRSWIDFEHGTIDEATYAERFFADRRNVDLAKIKAHMKASYTLLDGVEPLLAELKAKGVEMHALSNYSCWYRLIDEKLGLSRYIGWTFVSCLTGLRKPDPAAYLHALKTLGVAPAECVFVDDRRRNVEAAIAVGMRGVLRTSRIADLRAELARHGVAVSPSHSSD